jgi:peptidoglycan/LPS O-acetylase OafA/YrhL
MIVIAVSLTVASIVHLVGHVQGRSDLYDAEDAGIAEAVIAAVLAAGAVAMLWVPDTARPAGFAATGFAIVGFLVGLSITARAGHLPDIAYHAAVLPLLVIVLVALVRLGRPGGPGASRASGVAQSP